MPEDHVTDITHTIQLAIAPVFLLTALGTLLGVFSTRLGRIVDRARLLGERVRDATHERRAPMLEELESLSRRRTLVNTAITCATIAALLVCVLIAVAFVGSILHVDTSRWLAGLFVAVMAAFITALLSFLREIVLAVAYVRGRSDDTLRRERASRE